MRRFFIRIGALAYKEALHIRRDPRTLYLALGMPVVMLILFGFGVSFDLERIPFVVVDHDRSAASRELVEIFVASDDFHLTARLEQDADVEAAFRQGDATVGLLIPVHYSRDLARGERASVQILLDGADANSARQAQLRAEAMARVASARVLAAAGLQAEPVVASSIWTRFNPAGKSALYLVPGLIAYLLALIAVMLTALAVAKEWEQGSMEQLFATPVGRLEIVVGKLLPYLGLGVLQVLLVLSVGAWIFGVPIRGSLLLLATSSMLFMICMLGQGLLISVLTRNQMVATQAATLSSMLPSLLLSGFMFPIQNMPWPLQVVSTIVPARYYIAILRGVMLRGNGMAELWMYQLPLVAFALAMIVLSTLRFRRRLA